MPKAQLVIPTKDIRENAYFKTPVRVGEMKYWLKEARKVLPRIPLSYTLDVKEGDGYWLSRIDISTDTIYAIFEHQFEDRIHLVIAIVC